MAGYIGNKSSVVSSGAERKFKFTITETTTTLSNLVYTPTLVHVFHNGIRLVDGTDYTATNGTSITLTNAAENGDEVVVISYASFSPTDTYTRTEIDSKVNKTFIDNLNIDADTLDGQQGGYYLPASSFKGNSTVAHYNHSTGGATTLKIKLPFTTSSAKMITFTITVMADYNIERYEVSGYLYPTTDQWYAPRVIYTGTGTPDIVVGRNSTDSKAYVSLVVGSYVGVSVRNVTIGYTGSEEDMYNTGWSIAVDADRTNSVSVNLHRVWHAGNDGSGSGLDADTLDGQHGSYYYSAANPPPASAPTTAQVGSAYAAGTYLAVGQHTSHFWQTGANNPGQTPPFSVGTSYAGSNFSLTGTWLVVGASRAYATYYGNEYGWWNFIIKRTA